jgi:two-component system, cell cycle sensor histidine kinase and response regulator CckA
LSEPIATYQQLLKNKLFGIPADIPSLHRRYFIASNFMFIFALIGHSLFIPIFWILGSFKVFLYNLLCVVLDAVCLNLNHRRRSAMAYGIWVVEVTVHTCLCTIAFGWSAGFHYYILGLSVFVFLAPWEKVVNMVFLGSLMGIYIGLNTYSRAAVPTTPLAPHLVIASDILNIMVNFIALSYMTYHYAQASQKAQSALEESEKTLKITLAVSPVGIALIKERQVHWANRTLKQMLGYTAGESIDRNVLRFFPNLKDVAHFEHLLREVGQPFIDVPDTHVFRRDKTAVPCHIKIRPVTPKDRTGGSIVVIMDISERKAAEQEKKTLQLKVQRAEKMEAVGTLAGGVAHDLNNILSGLLSYPELLLMDLPVDHPMKKPLETIKRSGEKAAAIVQDLLTLARRGIPTQKVTDLNAIVEEYLGSPEHAKLTHYHPTVGFETRLASDLFPICGSPVHLSKTVMNLVSNASEAISDEGMVTISTHNRHIASPQMGYEIIEPGDYAVLSVADTGQGISAENLERIFEPFYTKKVMGRSGTGLGLAVVWGTVKDHAGYVDVTSVPGQGTRFALYFPRTRQLVTGEEQRSIDDYRGHGEHVLVVDDVDEQRIIAVSMLEKLGYRAEALSSGEAAVAWMQGGHTDLLMLDMIMDPGIDGLETYRRILKDHPRQKAIIASGYSETKRVSVAMEIGAAAYLKKPYTLFELAETVASALAPS